MKIAIGGTGLWPVVSGVAPETGETATASEAANASPQFSSSNEIRRDAGFDRRDARATHPKKLELFSAPNHEFNEPMDFITNLVWHDGKFLGIDWSVVKVVGWVGNLIFTSRFIVQWYATEKSKRVVVPQAFWWLSLFGSLTLLCYSIFQKDSVFIFAYAFSWFPYLRNLTIHRRNKAASTICAGCGQKNPPQANYCPNCGGKIV